MTAERIKITYATLRADNEDLQAAYEAGLEQRQGAASARSTATTSPEHERDGDGTFEVRSPIDSEILVGTFAQGHPRRRPGRDRGGEAARSRPGSGSAGRAGSRS